MTRGVDRFLVGVTRSADMIVVWQADKGLPLTYLGKDDFASYKADGEHWAAIQDEVLKVAQVLGWLDA